MMITLTHGDVAQVATSTLTCGNGVVDNETTQLPTFLSAIAETLVGSTE